MSAGEKRSGLAVGRLTEGLDDDDVRKVAAQALSKGARGLWHKATLKSGFSPKHSQEPGTSLHASRNCSSKQTAPRWRTALRAPPPFSPPQSPPPLPRLLAP